MLLMVHAVAFHVVVAGAIGVTRVRPPQVKAWQFIGVDWYLCRTVVVDVVVGHIHLGSLVGVRGVLLLVVLCCVKQ